MAVHRRLTPGRTKPAPARIHWKAGDVLLIIDCINDLEFEGGGKVLPWAMKLAPRLDRFRKAAHHAELPVVYVNDNFGNWQSNFLDVYKHCTRAGACGAAIAKRLKPGAADFFILKPRNSAFFSTSLIPLLEHLDAKRLILAGIATNLCVLFTAHDAHMHRYPLIVFSDCCAAESDFDHNIALGQLERFCSAEICLSTEYAFARGGRRGKKTKGKTSKKHSQPSARKQG
jgi:nicotinamidase-related amidase